MNLGAWGVDVFLVLLGVLCVLGAVVGGGFEAFGLKFPLLDSLRRQVTVGSLGLLLVVGAGAHKLGAVFLQQREAVSRAQATVDELRKQLDGTAKDLEECGAQRDKFKEDLEAERVSRRRKSVDDDSTSDRHDAVCGKLATDSTYQRIFVDAGIEGSHMGGDAFVSEWTAAIATLVRDLGSGSPSTSRQRANYATELAEIKSDWSAHRPQGEHAGYAPQYVSRTVGLLLGLKVCLCQ